MKIQYLVCIKIFGTNNSISTAWKTEAFARWQQLLTQKRPVCVLLYIKNAMNLLNPETMNNDNYK